MTQPVKKNVPVTEMVLAATEIVAGVAAVRVGALGVTVTLVAVEETDPH